MKKFITIFSLLLVLSSFCQNKIYSQTGFNSVLEYCTGTWCQWCPCGHTIVDGILINYPNTVVLAYHGPSNDPWISYTVGIRGLFGFSSYPSGVVSRKTGIVDRSAWNNGVVLQALFNQPGVSISISNKSYNSVTRTVSANITITALTDLSGDYYINYVLTEDNLIYSQTGNGSCPGSGAYVHDHVVKSMINGDLGELVNSGNWTTGQQIVKNLNYVLPDAPQVANPDNTFLNVFVYKQGTNIRTNYDVQQSLKTSVTGTTGISNNSSNTIPAEYILSQNYPNPFNPTTTFTFSIPKSGNTSLKFYDILGNEIGTYVEGFMNAGSYSVEFDGSNFASGIYFYTLTSGSFTETKKMNLIK